MLRTTRATLTAGMLVMGTALPAAASPLDIPGLLGWWNLDNATAADASGNGNHGVITGSPTATANRHGDPAGAALFGSTDMITLPDLSFTDDSAFTAALWVKVTDLASIQVSPWNLIPFEVQGGGTGYDRAAIVINENGHGLFWYSHAGGTGVSSCGYCSDLRTGSAPVLNDWVHVAGTWAPTPDGKLEARLYVDGQFIASSVTGDFTTAVGVPIIGGSRLGPSAWVGALDDVVVYDRALTAAEIAHLAEVTPVPLPAAAWLFGSGLVGLAAVARRRR